MARVRLRFIQQWVDRRRGEIRVRYYFRKPRHPRVALPGTPGSSEFMAAYQAALDGVPPPIGESRSRPGTISALVAAYYASPAFLLLGADTQKTYRSIIERFRIEHGDKRLAHLQRDHIEAMQAQKIATPAAANNWLRMVRMLMQFAVVKRLRLDDPTHGVKPIKHASQGFHTWSEEDIAAYETRHELGSKARLAMALMLYTGCRKSDVVALCGQNIKQGFLTYTQHKNRKRKPVTLTIPVHPELRRIIEATPTIGLKTFLITQFGKPFTANGFGNWMRDRCNEAGLPECSSHGLRKAIARRLAEAGMSPHQIMAITGHSTLKEVERYTRAASQKHLAEMAMRGLDEEQNGTKIAGKSVNRADGG